MIGLIGLLVLGNTNLATDPRDRDSAFFLRLVDESRSHNVTRPGVQVSAHALKLTFARPDYFIEGETQGQVISIRNHHGFAADTDDVHSGFDDQAGTPPEGSDTDWIHFEVDTVAPSPVVVFYCRPNSEATELPGGYIWIVVREDADVGTDPVVRRRGIYHLRIDLRKRIVTGDGPIDTRLVYGEPNDDGWYANANGMLRYVNFNPWIYKGGLFVGNMPMATGDGSGKARSQFWFEELDEDDEDHLQFMNFSLAHAGAPPMSTESLPSNLNHKGEVRIGLWAGIEQEGHTGVTESTATWENRWELTGDPWPTGTPGGILFPEWNPPTTPLNYTNFPLSVVNQDTGGMTHKTNAFDRLFLALVDESTFSDARWRYFISKESAHNGWPANSGFYSQDLKPRQWAAVLGYGDYTESTASSSESECCEESGTATGLATHYSQRGKR